MTISRRYPLEVADFIEKIEQHRGAPPHALSVYLAALLINKGDDLPPRCHVHELIGATEWLTRDGLLTWRREDDATVVQWHDSSLN